MERESILKRLRGLAAKTIENGCSEAEALASAEALARLMDRHGFQQTDLVAADREPIGQHGYLAPGKQFGNLTFVAPAVADFCDVKAWTASKRDENGRPIKQLQMLGRESDVLLATHLLHSFHAAMKSGWETHRRSPEAFRDIPQSFSAAKTLAAEKKGFEIGMMSRLSARLREMKAARNAYIDQASGRTGQSLMIVKGQEVAKAFADLNMKLRTGRSRRITGNGAYQAGKSAGDRVNISTGIGGGRTAGYISH